MSEQEEFLKDTKPSNEKDVFETPLEGKVDEKVIDENPELAEDSVKDRRHRRLEARLQAERESNIALAARLSVISEAKKSEDTPSEHLKSIERIYGTDTPEALAATELLKNAFKGVKDEAIEEALGQFRKEQEEATSLVKKEEQELDTMLEEIEDEYNVDLTSDKSDSLRKAFFKNLERLSPKDSDGNVIHYADHRAVWEELQTKIQKKSETRAKDLGDRSMIRSGASESKIQDDAQTRFLKENGII